MTIYIRLKELRIKRGLTQHDVADAIGLRLNGVQKIEYQQNKSIPYETLEKLCELLKCAPGDLLVPSKDEAEITNKEAAIALLESLTPISDQKWGNEYKARLSHGIREAIALLVK